MRRAFSILNIIIIIGMILILTWIVILSLTNDQRAHQAEIIKNDLTGIAAQAQQFFTKNQDYSRLACSGGFSQSCEMWAKLTSVEPAQKEISRLAQEIDKFCPLNAATDRVNIVATQNSFEVTARYPFNSVDGLSYDPSLPPRYWTVDSKGNNFLK